MLVLRILPGPLGREHDTERSIREIKQLCERIEKKFDKKVLDVKVSVN